MPYLGPEYQDDGDGPVMRNWRYVFCVWKASEQDYLEIFSLNDRGIPLTIYFRRRHSGRRKPIRHLDSVELYLTWDDYWKYQAQEMRWLGDGSEYDVEVTHGMLFPYLKPLLEDCYGPSDEGANFHSEMEFLCCIGTRDRHRSMDMNIDWFMGF